MVQRTAIPVVAVGLVPTPVAGDPYGSLARPGGSVTGFSTFGEELSGKRIELLRRALPQMTLLGILHNIADPVFLQGARQLRRQRALRGWLTCGWGCPPNLTRNYCSACNN